MKKVKFIRQECTKKNKLGKGRKKKQKWRKPTGIDSKVRLREKGYRKMPNIGYSVGKKNVKKIIIIRNLKELEKIGKGKEVLIGKIGRKKREEILKRVNEIGIKILNKYKVKKEDKSGGENATKK